MFRTIQRLLHLSEQSYRDMRTASISAACSNFVLMFPFAVVMQMVRVLVAPLFGGSGLDTGKLWWLVAAGIACCVLYFFVYLIEYDKTYTTAYTSCEEVRVEVAEKLRKLPLSFFNDRDLSELTTNIMGDCANIEHCMSHLVPQMIGCCISIALVCVMLAFYRWEMALAIFCMLPVSLLIIFGSRKLQQKLGKEHVQAKLEVSDEVQEYLEGIKVVKAFGLAGEKSVSLKRAFNRMMQHAMKFEAISGVFVTLAQVLLRVGTGVVVLVGVNLMTGGSLSLVDFITFMIISVKIYAPITTIMTMLPEFFYMLTATERMQRLREEQPMEGRETVTLSHQNVKIERVSFGYHSEEVIHDLNCEIRQNEVTALVGPSGSGKSTVSRLIARFWDVNKGKITIGGEDVSTLDPESLMQYMSFVFQDVVLFNDSVMNNIRIGKRDATDEEVRRAAKLAHCEQFIERLPDGYDEMLGENGCTLSGGERQRISIARAILKDAPIVMLDEATAALDPENEVLIQQAISTLIKNKTVLVIAHRLRTIASADHILVLNEGKLVEEGTSESLLSQDGLYARLWNIQQQTAGWSVKG